MSPDLRALIALACLWCLACLIDWEYFVQHWRHPLTRFQQWRIKRFEYRLRMRYQPRGLMWEKFGKW